jgi:hypothetical protein
MASSPIPILFFQPATSPRHTGRELKAEVRIDDVDHKRHIFAPPEREAAEFAPYFVRPAASGSYVDNFLKAYGLQSKRRVNGGLKANRDHLEGIALAPERTLEPGEYDLPALYGRRRAFGPGTGTGGGGTGAEEALAQGSILKYNLLGALGVKEDSGPADLASAKATSLLATARRDRVKAIHQGRFQTEKKVKENAMRELEELSKKGLPNANEVKSYATEILNRQPWEERQALVDFHTRLQESVGKENNSVREAWRKNFTPLQKGQGGVGEDGRITTRDFLAKLKEISERRESGGKAALSAQELEQVASVVDPKNTGVVSYSHFAALLGGTTDGVGTRTGTGAGASPEEPSAFTGVPAWQDSYSTPVSHRDEEGPTAVAPRTPATAGSQHEEQQQLPVGRRLLFSPPADRHKRVDIGTGLFAETSQSAREAMETPKAGKKRPGAIRATPKIVATDEDGTTESQRQEMARVKELASSLRIKTQQQGSNRQFYLRQVPHLADGTTSIKELAFALNKAGVMNGKVTLKDVGNLLALGDVGGNGGSDAASSTSNLAHQRVDYAQFAKALHRASASVVVAPPPVPGATAGTATPPRLSLSIPSGGAGGQLVTTVPQQGALAVSQAAAPHPQLSSLRVLASLTDTSEAQSRLLPAQQYLERENKAAVQDRVTARQQAISARHDEDGQEAGIGDDDEDFLGSPLRAGRGLALPGSFDEYKQLAVTAPEAVAAGRAQRDSFQQLFGSAGLPTGGTKKPEPATPSKRPRDAEDIQALLTLERCREVLIQRGIKPSELFLEADQDRVGLAVPAERVVDTLKRHGVIDGIGSATRGRQGRSEDERRLARALVSPERKKKEGGDKDNLVTYQEIVAALFPPDDSNITKVSPAHRTGKKQLQQRSRTSLVGSTVTTPMEQLEQAYKERRADHLLRKTMRENLQHKGTDARTVWLRLSEEERTGPINAGAGGAFMPREVFKNKLREVIGSGVVSNEDLDILVDRIQALGGAGSRGNEVSFTAFARAFRDENDQPLLGSTMPDTHRPMRKRASISSTGTSRREDAGLTLAGPRELPQDEADQGPPYPVPRPGLRRVVNPEGAFAPSHDSVAAALRSPTEEMRGRTHRHPNALTLENKALGEQDDEKRLDPYLSSQTVAFTAENTYSNPAAETLRNTRAFGMTTAQAERAVHRQGKRTVISAGPRLRGAAGVTGERRGPQSLGWLTGTPSAFLSTSDSLNMGVAGDASVVPTAGGGEAAEGALQPEPSLVGGERPAAGISSPRSSRAMLEGARTVTPYGISGGRKKRAGGFTAGPNHGSTWTEESGDIFNPAKLDYPQGPSPQDLAEEREKKRKYGPMTGMTAPMAMSAGIPSARLADMVSSPSFDIARSSAVAGAGFAAPPAPPPGRTSYLYRSASVPPALRSSIRPTSSVLVGSPPPMTGRRGDSVRRDSALFTPVEALGGATKAPKGYGGKRVDFGGSGRMLHNSNPFFL